MEPKRLFCEIRRRKNIVDLLKGRKGLPEIEDNEKDKEKIKHINLW